LIDRCEHGSAIPIGLSDEALLHPYCCTHKVPLWPDINACHWTAAPKEEPTVVMELLGWLGKLNSPSAPLAQILRGPDPLVPWFLAQLEDTAPSFVRLLSAPGTGEVLHRDFDCPATVDPSITWSGTPGRVPSVGSISMLDEPALGLPEGHVLGDLKTAICKSIEQTLVTFTVEIGLCHSECSRRRSKPLRRLPHDGCLVWRAYARSAKFLLKPQSRTVFWEGLAPAIRQTLEVQLVHILAWLGADARELNAFDQDFASLLQELCEFTAARLVWNLLEVALATEAFDVYRIRTVFDPRLAESQFEPIETSQFSAPWAIFADSHRRLIRMSAFHAFSRAQWERLAEDAATCERLSLSRPAQKSIDKHAATLGLDRLVGFYDRR
jgi:hypothetical protein